MRDIRTMLTLVHPNETLAGLKIFSQPMDRAEVLHARDFRPAVKRQPMFQREMTRRADSACPPINACNDLQHLPQRTLFENKPKHRFSMNHDFGHTMKIALPFGNCPNEFCGTSPSGKTFLNYLQPAVNRQPSSRQDDS